MDLEQDPNSPLSLGSHRPVLGMDWSLPASLHLQPRRPRPTCGAGGPGECHQAHSSHELRAQTPWMVLGTYTSQQGPWPAGPWSGLHQATWRVQVADVCLGWEARGRAPELDTDEVGKEGSGGRAPQVCQGLRLQSLWGGTVTASALALRVATPEVSSPVLKHSAPATACPLSWADIRSTAALFPAGPRNSPGFLVRNWNLLNRLTRVLPARLPRGRVGPDLPDTRGQALTERSDLGHGGGGWSAGRGMRRALHSRALLCQRKHLQSNRQEPSWCPSF